MTDDPADPAAAELSSSGPIPWLPSTDWFEARFWSWRARGAALNSLDSDFSLFTSVWHSHGRMSEETIAELRLRIFRGAPPPPPPPPPPPEPPESPPPLPGLHAYDW